MAFAVDRSGRNSELLTRRPPPLFGGLIEAMVAFVEVMETTNSFPAFVPGRSKPTMPMSTALHGMFSGPRRAH